MRIYFYSYLILLFSLFTLSSCEEECQEQAKSAFTISLTDDLTGMIVTKSTPSELGTPLASKFNLQIKNTQTGVLSYEGFCDKTYYEVPSATYDLFASYGTNPVFAFDSPYYKGELANQTVGSSGKNVVIPCSVANALVSVKYVNQAIFDGAFTSYGIVVTIGDLSLDWSSEHAQKSVYFKEGSSVSFVFKGILKAGSKEVTFPIKQGLPEIYKAKDHYILYLNYQAGQSKLDITTEKKEATINETVPQDWLPKPSSASTDFTNKVLIMKETMSPNAIINLKVARPLQDLKFKLELGDPNFQDLNKEYTLSSLSEQDKEALTKAGIVLPNIGSSEPTINMSSLTGKLQTVNGGQTVNNYISINPKANNRWNAAEGEDVEKYQIQVEKPEFKVSLSEGNIWTKEFTLDEVSVTAGNPEVIKKQIKYQYSDDDGVTWNDCNKGRHFQFSEHPKNKNYTVRILYRNDIVSSNIENVKLEIPLEIENGNMEDWHYLMLKKDIPSYYPRSNGGAIFWNTNNDFTTRYRNGTFSKPYNCFPAVSYTKNAHGGMWAAELRSCAAGRGNTWLFGHTELEMNRVPGELFIGDILITTNGTDAAPSNDYYTITNGKEFPSRPSALSFWYQYKPYTNDTWKVYVALYDIDKNLIIENTYTSSNSQDVYSRVVLPLKYDDNTYYHSCKYIYVAFSSSIYSGGQLPYETKSVVLWKDGNETTFKDTFIGSVLTIDDISLIYEK